MKLNIYLLKLIRKIEKEKGKKATRILLGVKRETIFRWEKNYWDLSPDNLSNIAEQYCDIFPDEDLKEVLMQGLVAWLEDTLKKINEKKASKRLDL